MNDTEFIQKLLILAIGVAGGFLVLAKPPNIPTYSKGKVKTTKSINAVHGFSLVASHDRKAHERILKSPRYYKDGVVPTCDTQLRRVKIPKQEVKRHYEIKMITNEK